MTSKQLSKLHRVHISQGLMGHAVSDKTRKACRLRVLAATGEKSWNWKIFSELSIRQKHKRLDAKYGKPTKCEFCNQAGIYSRGSNGYKRWNIEWANCDHKHSTDLKKEWKALCTKCHNRYDTELGFKDYKKIKNVINNT